MPKRTVILLISVGVLILLALSLWLSQRPPTPAEEEAPLAEKPTQEVQEQQTQEEIPEEFKDNLDETLEDLDAIDS